VNPARSRSERVRRIRHPLSGGHGRRRAARVPYRNEEIVVEVHVHNELPGADGKTATTTYVRTRERPSPHFSGSLFSWRDHYHPIFQKIVPLVAEKEARDRRWLAWLARLSLWAAALAALATLGCECFRS
jgi:hypothetical protein